MKHSWYTFEVKFTMFLTHHDVVVGKLSCHQSRLIQEKRTQMKAHSLCSKMVPLILKSDQKWQSYREINSSG